MFFMYNIFTLNKIAKCGTKKFDSNYSITDTMDGADAVMVRSASMHETELPKTLKAIARAGAGVNNIPVDKCSELGIVVFNTPGANANAVKELVLAGLLMSSRKVLPAIEWAKTLKGNGAEVGKMVEKGKGAFAGPEIMGKTLGVIGLGAIGVLVANAAHSLGMKVLGYDPYVSVVNAWGLHSHVAHTKSLDEIYAKSDYITVHVPLIADTKGMINKESLEKCKNGVRVLNFSRDALINDDDMIAALESGKVSCYVSDFPTDAVIGVENVIAIPHLGASSPESEDNCAIMAADELIDFLENGNIKNSVNLPNVSMPKSGDVRVCIVHKNIPAVLTQISGAISNGKNNNIENMASSAKKDYAYTLLDITGSVTDSAIDAIKGIDGIISVRTI